MSFILTDEDIENIRVARLNTAINLWENADLKYLRDKIKDSFISKPQASCSYCNRSLHGEFKMVIDLEHILPKSKFDNLIYEPKNLNISCKRCNMLYKKEKIDFIVDVIAMDRDYFNSIHYKFIHPNLDPYLDHLDLIVFQASKHRYLKYIIKNKSPKGKYTFDYFKLKYLEINCIDNAQGLQDRVTLSDKIRGHLRLTLIQLASKL